MSLASIARVRLAVLKQVDQTELLDRVIYAEELGQRSRNATDPTLRQGYASLAQAVLRAKPRAQVARQSAELIARAAALPRTGQAEELRRKAQELLEEHPPAPLRPEARKPPRPDGSPKSRAA
jgi:hypothetical protein